MPPTVSFPVAGTMMMEPTESESFLSLDRFIDGMKSIKNEINEIIDKKSDLEDNVLKNSPHTMSMVINSDWQRSYSVEKAVFPMEFVRKNKFLANS